MRGNPAACIHDMELPAFAAAIAGNQGVHDIARSFALAQHPDPVDAVVGVDQRLRGHRADPGGDMRHARTHGEKPGRHRDA